MTTTAAHGRRPGGRRLEHWDPEDEEFWERTGRPIARRNLWQSIFSEHIGFSVWTLWSVLVLFMGPEYGLDAAQKFVLVAVPTLVGAVLRLPYTVAVARFGGRNWTTFSAALLIVPLVLAMIVMEPGVGYPTLLLVAAVAGVGGGNFASSMANINAFFPERSKGAALGLNAGGGNLGVPVVQLLGLLVIGLLGAGQPRVLIALYLPLVVVSAVLAWWRMDTIADPSHSAGAHSARANSTATFTEVCRDRQTWIMSVLYIGTFGSFIGYSFAFGLVLQSQFGRTPLQAAAVTFIGPLIGSLVRPVGGSLADRFGGAGVTLWNFAGMAAATVLIIVASGTQSLAAFTFGFVLLFTLSGIGNGSTYTMIPAIFSRRARAAIAGGADREDALAAARRRSGAVIGIAGAVGALGGLFINLAFRESFAAAGSGVPAFWAFLAFYVLCIGLTWAVYLRPGRAPAPVGAAPARAS